MKDYLNGLPREKSIGASPAYLGFMGLDRFHAPASLIAMKHFVDFLHEIGLVTRIVTSDIRADDYITSVAVGRDY